ncbi:hypothetical protein ACFLT7_03715 [candidate division KSB1 bacterium]
MRLRRLRIFYGIVPILLLASQCGDKDTGPSEDLLYKNLIGKWTATRRTEENGVKLVETLSLLFQQQDDETRYRWTYSITYDGVEDEDESVNEDGTCTPTETELTFVPDTGEPRILSYVFLTNDPIYDLKIIDEDGTEWNMMYFAQFGHIP